MIPFKHPNGGDCEHACCLKIEHLSVKFGGEAALDDVNLHMHCGQMVALIGPNGAGKSTLIRAILGQREYEGKITFHASDGREEKLRIGYVPQSPTFDPGRRGQRHGPVHLLHLQAPGFPAPDARDARKSDRVPHARPRRGPD